jgi:AraC-like DNA-binding protein
MTEQKRLSSRSPQAGNVTFELHTLGWEAFQNLCGHVAQEVLGQTVTVFSPVNDVGQDGAFQGTWRTKGQEAFKGRLIIQCKFTAKRDEHLTLKHLSDEISKAKRLAACQLAQTYILITNAKVSGSSDKLIREAFKQIEGLSYFEIFGSKWLTQQILKSARLRAFVPRIYGLGDLSQILDERAYAQSKEALIN